MALQWHEWSDDVLRVARDERRPILLILRASWCRACREMERTTLSSAAVQDVVGRHAIAVRADKDAYPELVALYGQGAWPSTAVVDADGRLLGGGTWFDDDRLVELVEDAARSCRGAAPADRPARAGASPESGPSAGPSGGLDDTILPAVERTMLSHYDETHGGFGTGQKFPHTKAIDFAILRHASEARPRLHSVIEKTLTHMAQGELQDHVDGGFFRYCEHRDWTRPHTEKILQVNAGLLRNYLEAGQVMGRADFLEIGARTTEALIRDFFDEESGLFHESIEPADDYYSLDASGRRTRSRPRPDRRLLADGNSRAISALLKAGAVLCRADLTTLALEVTERLLHRLWRRGHGMFHFDDGQGAKLPGRLHDQAETARMLLHVLQYTDDRRFVPALDDLLGLIATAHVTQDGDFADRDAVHARRAVKRRETAFLDGAIAAEVLLRGALYTGRPQLADVARRSLLRHAADFRRFGYAMVTYGRSVELALHPPLHIIVVGWADDPDTEALLTTASETYLPSRVVQRLDPTEDAEAIRRLGLPPTVTTPVGYVFTARDAADHGDPQGLRRAMLAANARRLGA